MSVPPLNLTINNENYGYSVATAGNFVAISNPAITRYTFSSASLLQTGSIDYYLYNKTSNQHDFVGTLYRYQDYMAILLAAESSSKSFLDDLTTDINNTGFTGNKAIEIDKDLYTSSLEDGLGLSMDMYNTFLIAGSPYYLQSVQTSASLFTVSGSDVDVFDLSLTTGLNPSQSAFVFSFDDPDTTLTGSFGMSVAINSSWIAIGSPYMSASAGAVYIYQNLSTGSGNYNWQLSQILQPTGISISGSLFGWSVKLNKQSGSFSGSLIIGCGNPATNQAFYFEFISGSWIQTYIFAPTANVYPLTFGNYLPYTQTFNSSNGFGYSVSLFESNVIIGEYLDRSVYEFSGSSLYQQGSISIYKKCTEYPPTLFELILKSYGTSSILKNNLLGYSVDIFENWALAGIPKINRNSMTSCYIEGSTQQLNYCSSSFEDSISGQALLLQQNTSSNEWEIVNIYQKKKKYLSPYRCYGNSVALGNNSFVVGAPMLLSDTNRQINVPNTQSNNYTIDDISGKGYIYNFFNFNDQFHVGNAFYRNGKLMIMTSGSAFENLFKETVNANTYEYDMIFSGQQNIFEKQIICPVNPGEFNTSTNPTSIFKQTSSFDLNENGKFDFSDLDVILRYMQYKTTSILGNSGSTNWSCSIVTADDEISLLNYYKNLPSYNENNVFNTTNQSIELWETTQTWVQTVLDINGDGKIDKNDIIIFWKYFSNRLSPKNYDILINSACSRKIFSDVINYLDNITQRNAIPYIENGFSNYQDLSISDPTGSYLAPYCTTIGLYSGLDLVSVAKLGSPIKIVPNFPFNFCIKMDF